MQVERHCTSVAAGVWGEVWDRLEPAGLLSDMEFVRDWGNMPLDGQADDRVMSAVGQISYNLHQNPLENGENLNLVGTSMGSVTIAQAAIILLENPEKYGVFRVDNLVLGGSPIGKHRELFQRLQQLQKNGKIGQIHYDNYQIPDDDITGCAGRDDCSTAAKNMVKKGTKHPHLNAAQDKDFGMKMLYGMLVMDRMEGESGMNFVTSYLNKWNRLGEIAAEVARNRPTGRK